MTVKYDEEKGVVYYQKKRKLNDNQEQGVEEDPEKLKARKEKERALKQKKLVQKQYEKQKAYEKQKRLQMSKKETDRDDNQLGGLGINENDDIREQVFEDISQQFIKKIRSQSKL